MRINNLALLFLSTPAIAATNLKTITVFGLVFFVHETQAAITDGLLRLYRGDGDATDATGNGPTLNGEASYTDIFFPQSNTARKVFDFENTQNGLQGPCSGLPAGSSSRTMAGWFKFGIGHLWDGGLVDGEPFGYGRFAENENWKLDVYVSLSSGGTVKKYGVNLDVNGIDEGINPILMTAATTWFHVVVTYDQTSNTNSVYLNGQFLRSGTPSAVPNTNPDATFPSSRIIIGHRSQDPGNGDYAAYRGMVADVAIFNRVITPDEVTIMYSNDNWSINAGGGGDPHLVGFGGKHFTWQGGCDVVLITTPPTQDNKDDELHIHIRTRRVRKWSAIDTVAVKTGGYVAEIESNEGKLYLNGNEVSVINTKRMKSEKAISKKKKMVYDLMLDGDKYMKVTANKRTNMLFLSLNGNYTKETQGILGSPANPGFFGRDGKAMKGDVNLFVEGWQVNDNDPNLFRTRRTPQFPEKCSYITQRRESKAVFRERRLKESNSVSMEEAVVACANHPPGPLKRFCIDDVVETGELEVADDTFYG